MVVYEGDFSSINVPSTIDALVATSKDPSIMVVMAVGKIWNGPFWPRSFANAGELVLRNQYVVFKSPLPSVHAVVESIEDGVESESGWLVVRSAEE